MTAKAPAERTPLFTIVKALEEACGTALPPPPESKEYMAWAFTYPEPALHEQPTLAMESSVLWEKNHKVMGITTLIEEIEFNPWEGIESYFHTLNLAVAPFVIEYLPSGGLNGYLTPFWLGDKKDRRLVPAYHGQLDCARGPKRLKREFLDHWGSSAIMLLLSGPIFRRIAEGKPPAKDECLRLLQIETERHEFFIEERRRLDRAAQAGFEDPDEDPEEEASAPTLQ